jgi:phosphate starvation-inducible PhoH-like protein
MCGNMAKQQRPSRNKSVAKPKPTEVVPLEEKRVPLTPPKMKISLNDEQKEAKRLILENDIIVLYGKPGSGKTLVSAQASLDAFFNKQIQNILITRPTVSKEELGFLPGDLKEKLDPWVQPIYHNFYQCYDKNKVNLMIQNKDIDIRPLAYMRGITFLNAYVIIDECQNITVDQMKMIVTRIGKGSKLIFCGDEKQIDLKNPATSGLSYLLQAGNDIEGFVTFELKKNHRHEIVDRFVERFDVMDSEMKPKR